MIRWNSFTMSKISNITFDDKSVRLSTENEQNIHNLDYS